MVRGTSHWRALGSAIGAAAFIGGCSLGSRPAEDRFGATGQLVALSGAGAGARYACITCHGLKGEGEPSGVPRLAGLDAGYLDRQLEAYANGRRSHTEMSWIAKRLSARQRLAVAHYYAALAVAPALQIEPAPAPPLYVRGNVERGIASCASCHGLDGEGLGPANPPLAGQPAPYLADQIRRWRHAKRRNDPANVMLDISQRLSEHEAEVLAVYASRLSGDARRPESAAASR
jgi:cytochrome c553